MAKTTVTYTDRKGEPGKIMFTDPPDFDPTVFQTFFESHSYAGLQKYSTTAYVDFTDPAAAGADALVNNDKDFKAVLGFEGAAGRFKIEVPCPKINVEGGFVIRWGENRAYIPPVKTQTEVGDDGAAIEADMQDVIGDETVKFVYGRLKKKL